MELLRARELLERHLGEANRLRLARFDGLGHGAPGLLDRDRGIDSVQLVEIDDVGPQSLQTRVDRGAHVLGPPVAGYVELDAVGSETNLRREERSLAMSDERFAHELFVRERAI